MNRRQFLFLIPFLGSLIYPKQNAFGEVKWKSTSYKFTLDITQIKEVQFLSMDDTFKCKVIVK